MAHLIDKDHILAEIEKQQRRLCILSQSNEVELRKNAAIQNGVYCSLLSFLDTLKAKEVDLEKEINLWFDYGFPNDEELLDYIKETAKHFFELGRVTSNES